LNAVLVRQSGTTSGFRAATTAGNNQAPRQTAVLKQQQQQQRSCGNKAIKREELKEKKDKAESEIIR